MSKHMVIGACVLLKSSGPKDAPHYPRCNLAREAFAAWESLEEELEWQEVRYIGTTAEMAEANNVPGAAHGLRFTAAHRMVSDRPSCKTCCFNAGINDRAGRLYNKQSALDTSEPPAFRVCRVMKVFYTISFLGLALAVAAQNANITSTASTTSSLIPSSSAESPG